MFLKRVQLLLFAAYLLTGCGKGSVEINSSSYQPKVVIQGTLVAGEFARVKLRRNFALNSRVEEDNILIRDAEANIVDEDGRVFDLRFNRQTEAYENRELFPEYGMTYTLSVDATIDGKEVSASSATTVPLSGFHILEEKSRLGSMGYRPKDSAGNLINFKLVFERSPGTDYYAASIVALDADTTTFIYDNPFNDANPEDVYNDLQDYRHSFYWIQDAPLTPGESELEIFSFFTWFYGRYQVILYAADRNFRDFLSTQDEVQEIDGNFHEPAFHIEGDGIGVFGSAVADTAYFEIAREQ